MIINTLMAEEDVLCIECVCVCVLFPRRNSMPLAAANELWDIISINTTLVSTATDTHDYAHTHTTYWRTNTCDSIERKTVNRIKCNFQKVIIAFSCRT